MKKLILCLAIGVSSTSFAGYDLASNGKKVTCFAEDNQSFDLNAKRTTVKYSTEGESAGAKKITKISSDDATYVSYTTYDGTLTLSDEGDTYGFDGEEAYPVDCK